MAYPPPGYSGPPPPPAMYGQPGAPQQGGPPPSGPPPGYSGPPPNQQGPAYPPGQGGYPPGQGVPQHQGAYPQGPGYPQTRVHPQGYPQGGGYPGAGGVPPPSFNTSVIVAGARVVGGGFQPNPMRMKCTSCQADITTNINRKIGSTAWMVVGIMILIGVFIFPFILFGCCFIPLCMPSLKDVEHSCPNCKTVLGTFVRQM